MNKKLLSILMVLTAMLFASCSKKDEVVIDSRDQYVATYQVTDSWTLSGTAHTYSYTMAVTKSAQDPNVILLSNFGGSSDATLKAEVSGSRFTIQQQTVSTYGYSGSGTINGSTISFSYLVNMNGSGQINASSIGTKM